MTLPDEGVDIIIADRLLGERIQDEHDEENDNEAEPELFMLGNGHREFPYKNQSKEFYFIIQ